MCRRRDELVALPEPAFDEFPPISPQSFRQTSSLLGPNQPILMVSAGCQDLQVVSRKAIPVFLIVLKTRSSRSGTTTYRSLCGSGGITGPFGFRVA